MENDPTLEFEFFLGEKLKRTVAEIRQMSSDEFVGWSVYFGRKAQQIQLATQRR